MLKLKELGIINFQSHKNTIMQFSNGVNVICGLPNSGKTAICRALDWFFTNRPLGDRIHSNFTREKKTQVTIKTNKNTLSLIKFDNDEGYYIDGVRLKGFGSEVPEEIKNAFNISEINYQDQLSQHFLITSSPGEITKVINRITKSEKVDEWISSITTDINDKNKEIKFLEDQLIELDLKLSQYDNLDNFEKDVINAEKLQNELNEYDENIKLLNSFYNELCILDEKINKTKIILKIENNLNEILGLYDIINNKDKLLNNLEDLLKIQENINNNSALIELVQPIITKGNSMVDIINIIDNDILYLENIVKQLDKIELALFKSQDKKSKAELDYELYLSEIKKCPFCFSRLDDAKIKMIVYN